MQIEPQTKQSLIEEHYYINVDNDYWYDCIIDEFIEDMWLYGIEVEKVHFTGFCSQGDGACFDGSVRDWGLFLKHIGITCPAVTQLAKDMWLFSSSHRGRHSHHKSVHYDSELYNPNLDWQLFPEPDTNDLKELVNMALLQAFNWSELEEKLIKCFEEHMQNVYSRLNKAYDYLTTEEVIWEYIVANDLHLEEECDD